MKTYLGNLAPLPGNDAQVDVIDLVFQLGRTHRFGGWGNPEWTVLHHSMLTTIIYLSFFGKRGAHHALLHDAHEYITGDIPSPVKAAIGGDDVHRLERHLDKRIYDRMGLDLPAPEETPQLKVCDLAALIIEGYYFGTKGIFEHIRDRDWPNVGPSMRIMVRGAICMTCPTVWDAMKEWDA